MVSVLSVAKCLFLIHCRRHILRRIQVEKTAQLRVGLQHLCLIHIAHIQLLQYAAQALLLRRETRTQRVKATCRIEGRQRLRVPVHHRHNRLKPTPLNPPLSGGTPSLLP